MSHCHDEHGHHGHDHSEGAAHDHTDDITPALQNHIYEQIDFSATNTLNEAEPRSGSRVVQKTWTERLDQEPELSSDADEQLLMHVPTSFTAQIRLHSILIRTSTTSSAPQTLKLFLNRDDLDFSTASALPATQTLELAQSNEVQEVPVKRALFNTVRSLDLFFEDNWGQGEEDVTRVSYIGFKGEWMKLSREPVNFLYEAAANPADHKMVSGVGVRLGSGIGGAGGPDGLAAGDTVEVVVGAEKRTFHVHETLLRSRSAFFEAALSKEWKEGQARKVELLDDDVRAFEGYSRWLYTGKLAVVKSDQRTDYELLAMLCGFGEKIIDHRFQNCVLDAIVAGTRINVPKATGGVHKEFPGQNTVDRVYKATPKGSPARRLVLDMYTLKGNENWIRPGEKFSHEFLLDLVSALLKSRVVREDVEDKHKELGTGTPCSYHKHSNGETCAGKKT
ncbi:hypothetical protein LTR01_007574 [Friedmanniomyces endolithicus]|nr:hypothetical protein LTR01_007574 [Friedmanniomyces endolithicus]KAK0824710.1 hypothetical protein LTR73_007515 [Friedmanniomyces endolithicus]